MFALTGPFNKFHEVSWLSITPLSSLSGLAELGDAVYTPAVGHCGPKW